jgi:hypothetical protein
MTRCYLQTLPRPVILRSLSFRNRSVDLCAPRHLHSFLSTSSTTMTHDHQTMNGGAGTVSPRLQSDARLRGRQFYESLGSPKKVLAPMVNQSEFVRHPSACFPSNVPAHAIRRHGANSCELTGSRWILNSSTPLIEQIKTTVLRTNSSHIPP